MTSEAQKRAVARYDSENTVKLTVKLNKKTDADILDRLAAEPNKQGFIKDTIRAALGNSAGLNVVDAPDKWLFVYGMRLRGFSPGAQPKAGLIGVVDKLADGFQGYYDILLYNRPLTAEEIRDYELDEL